MNAHTLQLFLACAFVLVAGGRGAPALAQSAAPAPARPDTLALPTGAPDSLGVAVPDSVVPPGPDPWASPWRPAPAVLDEAFLEWIRAEDFERSIEWRLPGSVRVAGETGMDAFVDAGPLGRAPEFYVDGIPTRNPADSDPGIWDRVSTMVSSISDTRARPAYSWGGPAVLASLDDPLAGRTVVHTFFTKSRDETYTRAVGVRAPGTERMLRLDFQEFKTEEGYDYSASPDVLDDLDDRGRSKQRKFRAGGKAKTDVGEIGFEFGRGRRYTRGDVMSDAARERWTGRMALTYDLESPNTSWHARLYHLDFRDHWWAESGGTWQTQDGSRLGLRAERVVDGPGIFGGFEVERLAARFVPVGAVDDRADPHESVAGRVGLGWRAGERGGWSPWASLHAVFAGHAENEVDLGGRAGVRWMRSSGGLELFAERVPEPATLAETRGTWSRRLVTPVADGWAYDPEGANWTFHSGGEVPMERQDRVAARASGSLGRLAFEAGYSVWRLSRGIGWEAQAPGEARIVSGVEAELDMVEASVRTSFGIRSVRLRLLARGHVLPGNLRQEAGRPGGFPRTAALVRVGLDRQFFSPRNRIGVDLDLDHLGEHFDDLTGPIGGVLPATTTLDGRAWLSIRGAEAFFAIDNLLDAERSEVLGTWRRFRQFRFGLTWNFYN